jgi:hypothetical protein
MGYTTDFVGVLKLSRALTIQEAKTLLEINDDPNGDHEITERPLNGYMQWVPTVSLCGIVWDGNEKFYDYISWMKWLCGWLGHRGVYATGEIAWQGEERGDLGKITVIENSVTHKSLKPSKAQDVSSADVPLTLASLGQIALERLSKGVA